MKESGSWYSMPERTSLPPTVKLAASFKAEGRGSEIEKWTIHVQRSTHRIWMSITSSSQEAERNDTLELLLNHRENEMKKRALVLAVVLMITVGLVAQP